MKHLKYFNIDESVSNDTINDILLDLKDLKYSVKTRWHDYRGKSIERKKSTLNISITNNESFLYSDIEETINRLSGYLESEGYSVSQDSKMDIQKWKIPHKIFSIWYEFTSLTLLKSKSKYKI